MTYIGGSASNSIERLEIRQSVSFIERSEEVRVRARSGCEKRAVDRGIRVTCRNVPGVRLLLGRGNDRMANGFVSDRKTCRRIPDRGAHVAINGGEGHDVLLGTNTANGDDLAGGRGPDVILSCGGDDAIAGGAGADQLEGMLGDDRASGQRGTDYLLGCSGDPDSNDVGGDFHGSDSLGGGPGSDSIADCTGTDRLRGGAGRDSLDSIYANHESNPDLLLCGRGEDYYAAIKPDRARRCERPYGGFIP